MSTRDHEKSNEFENARILSELVDLATLCELPETVNAEWIIDRLEQPSWGETWH